jgi:hypothetical protein
MSAIISPTLGYPAMVPPFVLAGIGMGLFFAPAANVVLSAVRRDEEGKASGASNAIREVGGVFGVAVLASVFSSQGGYASAETFTNGTAPALAIGAAVVAAGAIAAFAIPGTRRQAQAEPAAA